MRCKKNITLKLENLSSYFTGKNKIITLSFIILMLSFVNIILCLSNSFSNSVSALSYESNVGIGFTFNPTLTISFSSSDLVIDNLVPGSSSDSNVINVNVSTNASHGYTLAVNTNSDNLVHSNNTNVFNSIATDASIEGLTSDNTWGYSYKLSNDTTWSNYSGLSSSTTKTLVNTDNQSSKPIDFKIGAKASTAQASGEYTNIINFIAVSKPIPRTIDDIIYMQTFGELVPTDLQSVKNSMVLNSAYILKDIRDEKEYYVTRLEDGNIWMTQNLDLDLSSEVSLTSDNTDLNLYGSMGYDGDNGYTCSNPETIANCANNTEVIAWAPERSTILPGELNSETWVNDGLAPYSYDRGLVYPDNNVTEAVAGNHGLAGNYYNWTAAIASNNSSSYSGGNAANSICPKGWRLPNSTTYEFSKLLYIHGIGQDTVGTAGYKDDTGFLKMASSPLWFIRSGYISGGSLDSSEGRYIAGTAGSSNGAYNLFYASWGVAPDNNFYRRHYGWSIRCLAK